MLTASTTTNNLLLANETNILCFCFFFKLFLTFFFLIPRLTLFLLATLTLCLSLPYQLQLPPTTTVPICTTIYYIYICLPLPIFLINPIQQLKTNKTNATIDTFTLCFVSLNKPKQKSTINPKILCT